MKALLTSAAVVAALMAPGVASAAMYDWTFAGATISGSGTLDATPLGGGLYTITSGSGTVTDSNYGTSSITFAACASPLCTAVNTDGFGLNLTYDNYLWPGNAPGSQLDVWGVVLELASPFPSTVQGVSASAVGVWDASSTYFFGYGDHYTDPNGGLSTPFTVTAVTAPEPATWAMMGLGFAALGLAGFRKARATRAIAV